ILNDLPDHGVVLANSTNEGIMSFQEVHDVIIEQSEPGRDRRDHSHHSNVWSYQRPGGQRGFNYRRKVHRGEYRSYRDEESLNKSLMFVHPLYDTRKPGK